VCLCGPADNVAFSVFGCAPDILKKKQAGPPKPYGSLPSDRQLKWQRNGDLCLPPFSPNHLYRQEWGYGDENPTIFNPTDFNADQIVKALKTAVERRHPYVQAP